MAAIVAGFASVAVAYQSVELMEDNGERVACPQTSLDFGFSDCRMMLKMEQDYIVWLVGTSSLFKWKEGGVCDSAFDRAAAVNAVRASQARRADSWIWGSSTYWGLHHDRPDRYVIIRRGLDPLVKARTAIHEALHHVEPAMEHPEIKEREECLIPNPE